MPQLFELCRPKTLAGIVGQSKAVKVAQSIMDRGAGGQSILISGPSGTGKSTLARIIAESVADSCMIVETVGADVSADWLRNIAANRQFGWGKGGRAYIVEECHSLSSHARDRLNLMLEQIPDHVVWLFTTTNVGEDRLFGDDVNGVAFGSRCVKIGLTNQGTAGPFAELLHDIAVRHGLNGCPNAEAKAMKIVRDCKGNMRAAIQEVAAGAMIGGEA